MIYSLTKGLGYGSETWIAGADGQNPRRVLYEPAYLVLFPRWSPDGSRIAFIRIPDTNVPFPMGELWVMDGEGNNLTWISAADGGRGYEPVWSPDSSRIAFVGRENPDDPGADQIAERLSSNIYVADLNAATVFPATQFTNALAENPSWSPDGAYLAFNTNAGGAMDVWVYDIAQGQLQQVTQSANARYPVWLSLPLNGTPTP
jgi:TolB protein